jgi:hypothetical protein
MRVNISKSKFFAEQKEYLAQAYRITRQGIQHIPNKVEMNDILNIKEPKTRQELCQFISIVNITTCDFAEVTFYPGSID